jgi:gas vesicle protein
MEKTEMECNRKSAVPPFLLGIGTGVALALLLAPRTGTATRKLIGRKAQDGGKWAEDKADTAKKWVLTQGVGLRERVKDGADAIVGS